MKYAFFFLFFFLADILTYSFKIGWNDRFLFPPLLGCSWLFLDTAVAPIELSNLNALVLRKKFWSEKFSVYGQKYEIAVGVQGNNTRIFWSNGPFPAAFHDITIAREFGFLDAITPGEYVIADKGYFGEVCFLTPWKRNQIVSPLQEQWNYFVHSKRVLVENAIRRVKKYKCLKYKWRHDLDRQALAWSAAVNLANVDIMFHPLHV